MASGNGDASQFGAMPNAALANAAARRLGGDPSLNSFQPPGGNAPPSTIFGGPPVSGGTHPQPPNTPFTPTPPNAPPYAATPVQARPVNGDPLIGGTGDAKLDSYLGTDSTYQTQLSDLMRNYDQYNAQKNLASSQTQADYDAKQRALNTQSTQDQLNMRNAAASRGILQSGIYANQLGQYNDANQQQLTNLLGGLQNSNDNAALGYNNFVANEMASKEQAIQQAAARRSSQLGLV